MIPDIPNDFISCMLRLEGDGLIEHNEDKAYVKIPVIKKCDYNEIMELIRSATEKNEICNW